jgi:hypothetical protein
VRWQLPEDATIPFQPATGRLRANFAGNELLRCESLDRPASAEAPPQSPLAAQGCTILFGEDQPVPEAIQQLRQSVRILLEVGSQDQPAAIAPAEQGRILYSATAFFQVLPDGRPANCRTQVSVPPANRAVVPLDLCALLQRSTLYLFEEGITGSPAGRLSLTVRADEGR